ncbi:HD domain-containing protein [Thalassospira sp.]|uniref:HD domain-containing protein n=1 Tax=Thalassospira sp. TaxID=1912094 RepID=UPI0027343172|nr:HD domain-containing protein [Thalassospira sp.]MDP2699244.1 HD domain-containing protein [Thalassospira sp.]
MQLLLKSIDFAARAHRDQRRKGPANEPYINHPIEVARLIAECEPATSQDILCAAILHDVIEDCGATQDEIAICFNPVIAGIVAEVSDDKDLPRPVRKARQIETAPDLSDAAKLVRLADKIANVGAMLTDTPIGWDRAEILRYVDWAEAVVAPCRPVSPALSARFDAIIRDVRVWHLEENQQTGT